MIEFTILEWIIFGIIFNLIIFGMWKWAYYLGYKSEKRRKARRSKL